MHIMQGLTACLSGRVGTRDFVTVQIWTFLPAHDKNTYNTMRMNYSVVKVLAETSFNIEYTSNFYSIKEKYNTTVCAIHVLLS